MDSLVKTTKKLLTWVNNEFHDACQIWNYEFMFESFLAGYNPKIPGIIILAENQMNIVDET